MNAIFLDEYRGLFPELRVANGVTALVEAWFEVDHAKQRIVVTKLDVPPRES
jgi:hypothetical protein